MYLGKNGELRNVRFQSSRVLKIERIIENEMSLKI